MPAFYYLDPENSRSHVPDHPERTVYGGKNPFSVYYRVFNSRAAMSRWLKHQSWEERQAWYPWMSIEANRILLARHMAVSRRQSASAELQPTLF